MDSKLLEKVESSYLNKNIPDFEPGDTIAVSNTIREGSKKRTQVFKGIVIAIKGSGTRKTFTIRKISGGIGVEKIFPMHSPNIKEIKFIKKGKVRRSKLYYMRDRIGKQATKIVEGTIKGKMARQHKELETRTSKSQEEREKKETKEETKK